VTFPAGLATVEVTGEHLADLSGAPLSGYVLFTASAPVVDPAGDAVLFGSAMAQVIDGTMLPVTVPATDAVSPAFTYTVTLRLDGPDGNPPPYEGISIPASSPGGTVDLSALLA
jgi:hypothetical protein